MIQFFPLQNGFTFDSSASPLLLLDETPILTPGDEYNKFWREGSPKLLKTKLTEQFGTPLPRGRLIILVTKRPEFSAILNWALREYHAFWPPF